MEFRKLFILFSILCISSCGLKIASLNQEQATKIPPENGLVIIGLESNRGYHKVQISGEASTNIDYDLLKEADPFLVISLPQGDYEFSRIWLTQYNYLKLADSSDGIDWSFNVKAGAITYVGNLVLTQKNWNRYFIRNINQSSLALEFLEDDYSNLLATHKLRFSGSDKDKFFSYIAELKGYKL
jgi:hypothetical protein